jgi:putative NADPH-quinone reductase
MKVSIILAHPNPGSFNHAIANAATEALWTCGHQVALRDLYQEKFDPCLPISELARDPSLGAALAQHCDEIQNAGGIIIIHPNWWGSPPAILKGWIDRVLRPDVAYKFVAGDNGEGVPVGLLKAQSAIVFNTANTTQERELAVFGDPLELVWKRCVFSLCGVKNVTRKTFAVVITSSPELRKQWLDEVKAIVKSQYPAR